MQDGLWETKPGRLNQMGWMWGGKEVLKRGDEKRNGDTGLTEYRMKGHLVTQVSGGQRDVTK